MRPELEIPYHRTAVLLTQPETLSFRQQPTLEDCFPASTKLYKDVQHDNGPLRVGAPVTTLLAAGA